MLMMSIMCSRKETRESKLLIQGDIITTGILTPSIKTSSTITIKSFLKSSSCYQQLAGESHRHSSCRTLLAHLVSSERF